MVGFGIESRHDHGSPHQGAMRKRGQAMAMRKTLLGCGLSVVVAGTIGVAPAQAVERNTTNGYQLGAGLALGQGDTAKRSLVVVQSLRNGKRVDTDFQCGAADGDDPIKVSGGLALTEPGRIYLEVRIDRRGAAGTVCDRVWQSAAAAGALDLTGRGLVDLVSNDMGRAWSSLPKLPDLGNYNDDLVVSPKRGAVLTGDPVEGWSEWSPDRPQWTRAYPGKTFGYHHPQGPSSPLELRIPRLGGASYFDFITAAQGAPRTWILDGYGSKPVKRVRWRLGSRSGRSRLNIPAPVFSRLGFLPKTNARCRTGPRGVSNSLDQAVAQSSTNGRVVWGVSGREGLARCRGRRISHGVLPRVIVSRNYGKSWRPVSSPAATKRGVFLLAVDGASPVITTGGCGNDRSRWWRLRGRKFANLGCHARSGSKDEDF